MGRRALIFISFISFISCTKIDTHHDKPWKTYTIEAGEHFSSPSYFEIYTAKTRIDSGCIMLDSSMIYDLESTDQLDFNKFRGFRFGAGTVDGVPKKTAQVGWRWNTKDSCFEVGPYYNNHPTKLIDYPDSNFILCFKPGEIVHFVRRYDRPSGEAFIHIWNDSTLIVSHRFMGHYNLYYSTGFYFGGNNSAPHTMKMKIKD